MVANLAHSLTLISEKGSVCCGKAATGLAKTIVLRYGTSIPPDSLQKFHDVHETAEKPGKRGSICRKKFRSSCNPVPCLAQVLVVGCVPGPLFGSLVRAPPLLFSERNPNRARICLARRYDEALFAMALHEPWILLFCAQSRPKPLDSVLAFVPIRNRILRNRILRKGASADSILTRSQRTLASIALPPLLHAVGILYEPLRSSASHRRTEKGSRVYASVVF